MTRQNVSWWKSLFGRRAKPVVVEPKPKIVVGRDLMQWVYDHISGVLDSGKDVEWSGYMVRYSGDYKARTITVRQGSKIALQYLGQYRGGYFDSSWGLVAPEPIYRTVDEAIEVLKMLKEQIAEIAAQGKKRRDDLLEAVVEGVNQNDL